MKLFSEVVLCECFCVGPETGGAWWSDLLECWSGAFFFEGMRDSCGFLVMHPV